MLRCTFRQIRPSIFFEGFFVICRLSDGMSWSGEKWVAGWLTAKHYPPAPTDGFNQAAAERDRLNDAGERCVVLCVDGKGLASHLSSLHYDPAATVGRVRQKPKVKPA